MASEAEPRDARGAGTAELGLLASPLRPRSSCVSIGETAVPVRHVLTFYSTKARSDAEAAADERVGIDRRAFSNLYACPAPLEVTQGAAQLDDGSEAPQLAHAELEGRLVSSSESWFQAAKCALLCDALFTAELSGPDAARFGQGRMTLTPAQKARLVELGADEADFVKHKRGFKRNRNEWKGRIGHVERVGNWEAVKPSVMLAALRCKFAETAELGRMITNLAKVEGGVLLVEHTENDRVWADAADGSGTNFLGKLLTQLVHERRTGALLPVDAAFLRRRACDDIDYAPLLAETASSGAGAPGAADAAPPYTRTPEWWRAMRPPDGKIKKLPAREVDAADASLWSCTGSRTGAVMLDTGDGTHCTISFCKVIPEGKSLEDAKRALMERAAAAGVATIPVLPSLTGMMGANSALLDPSSPLARLVTDSWDHLEALAEGWLVDRNRPPHIEVCKWRPRGGQAPRRGGRGGGGARGGGARGGATGGARGGSGEASGAGGAGGDAPAWWRAVEAPGGKRKALPAREVDVADAAVWSVTKPRGGGGGTSTAAVMVDTGDGTHCTVAFCKRVPAGKTPGNALHLVREWAAANGFSKVAVRDALTGMYGKNSALVDPGSQLGKLIAGAWECLEARGDGWEIDRDRKPHIEIMKR